MWVLERDALSLSPFAIRRSFNPPHRKHSTAVKPLSLPRRC